ncbi:hypothetical protein pb186bvf_018332 [Paramecium bursaria]
MKYITDFYTAIRQISRHVTGDISSISQQMIQTDIRAFLKIKRIKRSGYERLRHNNKLRRISLKQSVRYRESLITHYFAAINRR